MKKTLGITGIIILLLILILIALPYAFKGRIKEQVKQEFAKNLNAAVDFSGVGISLVRHFPDATIRIDHLVITGINDFRGDTLIFLPETFLTVNMMSIFRGNEYRIKRVILDSPVLRLKVLKNGKANWDISKPSGDTSAPKPSTFKIRLQDVAMDKAVISYDDAEMPGYFRFDGISGSISGDMTADITSLELNAKIDKIIADYSGIRYLNNVNGEIAANLEADLSKDKYTFKNAVLRLNALNLAADGWFALLDQGYDMDMKFAATENSFKAFLSLIPAIYSRDFDKMKAAGSLAFKGFAKGVYNDSRIPAFGADIKIEDGSFSYPGLPGNVSHVTLQASVSNADGLTDHTITNVRKLHLQVIKNPVDAAFTVKTPVSDPEIDGWVKGVLNLGDISKIYPLGEKTELSGMVKADVAFKGRISSIENGKYDQFKAAGTTTIENIHYASPGLQQPVDVRTARMDFSPQYLALSDLMMTLGKNDLKADGRLENYLPYLLKKSAVLKGSLTTASNLMDLNSLMSSHKTGSPADSSSVSAIEIPSGLDLELNAGFNRILYDKYDLSQVKGTIRIKDKAVVLNGLNASLMDGSVLVNGEYATPAGKKPRFNFTLSVKEINIAAAFKSINTLKILAPIGEKLSGKFTTNLSFSGDLKENLMPVLTSLTGNGQLLSSLLGMQNVNTVNKIAESLQIDKLKNLAIEQLNLKFELQNGNVFVKPTTFSLGNYKASLTGTSGLDKSINFILNLDIPRSEFGGKANSILNKLVAEAANKGINASVGDLIPVTLLITGTIDNPRIVTGLKNVMNNAVDDLKKQVETELQAKKQEAVTKAKMEAGNAIATANAEAEKVIADAQKEAQQLLKAAQLAADKARAQADTAIARLNEEAKQKGALAELGAKAVSNKLRKEADSKVIKLMSEAQQKADAIVGKAKEEADRMRKAAQTQVDKQ